MKKIYSIAIIMIIATINLNAQTYNIQQTIGTGSDYSYTSSSNTIISGGNQVLSTLQTIPFDFTLSSSRRRVVYMSIITSSFCESSSCRRVVPL